MPCHLAILHTALFWTLEQGEGEGRSRARRTSQAVQEHRDIASKQQGSYCHEKPPSVFVMDPKKYEPVTSN
jgi:hypothetical protein